MVTFLLQKDIVFTACLWIEIILGRHSHLKKTHLPRERPLMTSAKKGERPPNANATVNFAYKMQRFAGEGGRVPKMAKYCGRHK